MKVARFQSSHSMGLVWPSTWHAHDAAVHDHCHLAKERPPPTFGPISSIVSKFTWMSTLPGASFTQLIRVHLWSVEKHSIKRYTYLRIKNFMLHYKLWPYTGNWAKSRGWVLFHETTVYTKVTLFPGLPCFYLLFALTIIHAVCKFPPGPFTS